MNASSASKYPLLALVVLAGLGAAPYRPAPKFEGNSIPDPPRQKEPWTPPQTKLPRFLVSATAALFEQGMADPRGCEYREVEMGDGTIVKTRGFVLPERAGEAGRFVVSWDGVVYPALSVGAPGRSRQGRPHAGRVHETRPRGRRGQEHEPLWQRGRVH